MTTTRPALAAALLATISPTLAASGIRLSPGQSFTHVLPANPSTGYSWRVVPTASENLTILTIEDLGHAAPKETRKETRKAAPAGPIVGAPQAQSFKITGKSPGTAKIAFEYVRPWETTAPARREALTLTITP